MKIQVDTFGTWTSQGTSISLPNGDRISLHTHNMDQAHDLADMLNEALTGFEINQSEEYSQCELVMRRKARRIAKINLFLGFLKRDILDTPMDHEERTGLLDDLNHIIKQGAVNDDKAPCMWNS